MAKKKGSKLADHNHESHDKGGHCYACGGMVKASKNFASAIKGHQEK